MIRDDFLHRRTPTARTTSGSRTAPRQAWTRSTLPGLLVAWLVSTVMGLWQVDLLPHGHSRYGMDFGIYLNAAHNLLHGSDPYAAHVIGLGFVYPPGALALFIPLVPLGHTLAYAAWIAVDGLCLSACVAATRLRTPWVVVVTAALTWSGYVVRTNLTGQVGLVLLAMVVLDLVVVPRRFRGLLTGVAIGLKFTPAVFLAWFVARRDWPGLLRCVLGFVLMGALGFAMAPHTANLYWHNLLLHGQLGHGVPANFGGVNNQSLTNAVMLVIGRSVAHFHLARALSLVAAAIAGVAGTLAASDRRRDRTLVAIGLLGTASCLATSSTWDHHYVWSLALVLGLLTGEFREHLVAAAATVVWTLWGFARPWTRVSRHAHLPYRGTTLIAAIGSPALATLTGIVCLAAAAWTIARGARRRSQG